MTFHGFETDDGNCDDEELHVYTSGDSLRLVAIRPNESLVEVILGYDKIVELASLLNSMQWRLQKEREAAAK